jgi:hypothetical protein
MKMPSEYDDDFLGLERGVGTSYPDGIRIRTRVFSLVYPPPGFFPFYGIGNGDYHGFYWPTGREEGQPIVAFSSHDAWSLIPENSDIEALYRCQLATSDGDTEAVNHYRQLAETAIGKPTREPDILGLKYDDFHALLSLDQTSPFFLCASADVHVANNDIEAAEQRYRQSLVQLPEYVAAQFGLAYVLRRQRRAAGRLRFRFVGRQAAFGASAGADRRGCLRQG